MRGIGTSLPLDGGSCLQDGLLPFSAAQCDTAPAPGLYDIGWKKVEERGRQSEYHDEYCPSQSPKAFLLELRSASLATHILPQSPLLPLLSSLRPCLHPGLFRFTPPASSSRWMEPCYLRDRKVFSEPRAWPTLVHA